MTSAEVAWGFYNGVESGDFDTALALIAPDCAWTEMDGFPYRGTFTGPDAIVRERLRAARLRVGRIRDDGRRGARLR